MKTQSVCSSRWWYWWWLADWVYSQNSMVVEPQKLFHNGIMKEERILSVNHSSRVLDVDDNFVPLSCNNAIAPIICRKWTNVFGSKPIYQKRIVIPCGQCIYVNVPRLLIFGGLDIQGKFVVNERAFILETTSIVVQGILEMSATKPVDGIPVIRIVMIGEKEEVLFPSHDNAKACGGAQCILGMKAITVLGGQLNSEFNKAVGIVG